jgi:hypothetical protein
MRDAAPKRVDDTRPERIADAAALGAVTTVRSGRCR